MSFYHTGDTPEGYECGKCKATGVKLWRLYQTFLNHQKLFCAPCVCKEAGVDDTVDDQGFIQDDLGGHDSIGWHVPAVPTEENDTYWGYTSVPADGVTWWGNLPTRK